MNIEFTNHGCDGKRKTLPVAQYVTHRLNHEEGGLTETALAQALSAQEAVGRLVELLAEKGVMTAEEVMYIVGWKSDCAKLKSDTQIPAA